MVQLEVAERLAAKPGSKTYGVPSVKAAWYADVELAGKVGRNVFWPAPNVDSGLVSLVRRDPPQTTASREEVFRCIDAAFAPAPQVAARRAGVVGRLAGARRGGPRRGRGRPAHPRASSSTSSPSRASPRRQRRSTRPARRVTA